MNVIVFGASGMVGQSVLRAALGASDVIRVTVIVRERLAIEHPKLRQIVSPDPTACDLAELRINSINVCFYCIGVSAAGSSEAYYRAITYTSTLDVARRLLRQQANLHFVYVSAHGADRSGTSKVMWARVRGEVENVLCNLPLRALTIVRPSLIQPLDGIRSKTSGDRRFYQLSSPLLALARLIAPNSILTTHALGRVMLSAGRREYGIRILEPKDLLRLAQVDKILSPVPRPG